MCRQEADPHAHEWVSGLTGGAKGAKENAAARYTWAAGADEGGRPYIIKFLQKQNLQTSKEIPISRARAREK